MSDATLTDLFGEEVSDEEVTQIPKSESIEASTDVDASASLDVTQNPDDMLAMFGDDEEPAETADGETAMPPTRTRGEDGEDDGEENDADRVAEAEAIEKQKRGESAVAKAVGSSIVIGATKSQLPDPKSHISWISLPNVIAIDPKGFDASTYAEEKEKELSAVADEESNARWKPGFQFQRAKAQRFIAENVIRWREQRDSNGQVIGRESNARLIEWSNGTKQLWIGGEVFEILERQLDHHRNYLYGTNQGRLRVKEEDEDGANEMDGDYDESGLNGNHMGSSMGMGSNDPTSEAMDSIEKKRQKGRFRVSVGQVQSTYAFRVTSIHSASHAKLTQAVQLQHTKEFKLKRTVTSGNPEQERRQQQEMDKLEEKRVREAARKEERRYSERGGAGGARSIRSKWLEEGSDDDEGEAEHEGGERESNNRYKRRGDVNERSSRVRKAQEDEEYDLNDDFIDNEEGDEEEDDEDEAELLAERSAGAKRGRGKVESESDAVAAGLDDEDEEELNLNKKSDRDRAKRRKLVAEEDDEEEEQDQEAQAEAEGEGDDGEEEMK